MKYGVVDMPCEKPKCDRCGFSHNYVIVNNETQEFICPACLTEDEMAEIKSETRKKF